MSHFFSTTAEWEMGDWEPQMENCTHQTLLLQVNNARARGPFWTLSLSGQDKSP